METGHIFYRLIGSIAVLGVELKAWRYHNPREPRLALPWGRGHGKLILSTRTVIVELGKEGA